jgi:hypothetical protein
VPESLTEKEMNNLKISFLAPTGYGKTTAANFIIKKFDAIVIKLAEPLYVFQKFYYDTIGKEISSQDGELLQFFGQKIQNDAPNFLFESFQGKMKDIIRNSPQIIIVNDDCRPGNYEKLKDIGFVFIRIEGKKYNRNDITPVNPSHSLEWGENIPSDFTISNMCDIDEFRNRIISTVDRLIKEKGILCKTEK